MFARRLTWSSALVFTEIGAEILLTDDKERERSRSYNRHKFLIDVFLDPEDRDVTTLRKVYKLVPVILSPQNAVLQSAQ
jgi:hypothetical protein